MSTQTTAGQPGQLPDADGYIAVTVGATAWRVRPGSIGEALARYAARRHEPGGDLYEDPGARLRAARMTYGAHSGAAELAAEDAADLARWESEGGAL